MSADDRRTLVKGDSITYRITVSDVTGAAYSLTGKTVKFTLKRNLTDSYANAAIKKSSTNPLEIAIRVAPNNNQADIYVKAADTAALIAMPYFYDISITDPLSLAVHTPIKGVIVVSTGVTNG